MNLSEVNRTTLLTYLHKSIEVNADTIANKLNNGETSQLVDYPQTED